MTTVRLWSSALCSLVPCAGLLTAIALAGGETPVGGLADAIGFVAVPSMIAIVAGRATVTRLVATGIMAAVAVFAGLQIGNSNGGLAGLAVIYVPMVAFPLAALVWLSEAIDERYRS